MIKNLGTIGFMVLLASCGKSQPLKTAGKLAEGLVNAPKDITRHVLDIEDHKDTDLTEVNNRLTQVENNIDNINQVLDGLEDLIDDNSQDQDSLSQLVALNQSRLAALESNQNITNIIDPCGDYPNHFDEVILQTDKGKFLAYYQQGSHRFLAELPDGNYQTTDKQKCNFSISSGELND